MNNTMALLQPFAAEFDSRFVRQEECFCPLDGPPRQPTQAEFEQAFGVCLFQPLSLPPLDICQVIEVFEAVAPKEEENQAFQPTVGLTDFPTEEPTEVPTEEPTDFPTEEPTDGVSTDSPINVSTEEPTEAPTDTASTSIPTTFQPTSSSPTEQPTTESPTLSPSTVQPTSAPTTSLSTSQPTAEPTISPTTLEPTAVPTTSVPTTQPTANPTLSPTFQPTEKPTEVDLNSVCPGSGGVFIAADSYYAECCYDGIDGSGYYTPGCAPCFIYGVGDIDCDGSVNVCAGDYSCFALRDTSPFCDVDTGLCTDIQP